MTDSLPKGFTENIMFYPFQNVHVTGKTLWKKDWILEWGVCQTAILTHCNALTSNTASATTTQPMMSHTVLSPLIWSNLCLVVSTTVFSRRHLYDHYITMSCCWILQCKWREWKFWWENWNRSWGTCYFPLQGVMSKTDIPHTSFADDPEIHTVSYTNPCHKAQEAWDSRGSGGDVIVAGIFPSSLIFYICGVCSTQNLTASRAICYLIS